LNIDEIIERPKTEPPVKLPLGATYKDFRSEERELYGGLTPALPAITAQPKHQ